MANGTKERAVWVNDDPNILETFDFCFGQEEFELDLFTDQDRALKHIRENLPNFSLIGVNYQLDKGYRQGIERTGVELAIKIRQLHGGSRVAIILETFNPEVLELQRRSRFGGVVDLVATSVQLVDRDGSLYLPKAVAEARKNRSRQLQTVKNEVA